MSRELRRALEARTVDAASALDQLLPVAKGAAARATRMEAYDLIGEIAGRAFDVPWEVAERAAWMLLQLAGHANVVAERRGLLHAVGRGFRNLWLMPFVHGRLHDERPEIVEAAITAAGGLGFAALEEAVASRFLGADVAPNLRVAAVTALGRMGALGAAQRLLPLIEGEPAEAVAAMTALGEMRSTVGAEAAAALLDRDPPREVQMAAIRYLSEMGRKEVPPILRRLGRDDDPEMRALGSLCARAFKGELERDPGDRILIALTERDRAVRAILARRLRTLPIDQVLEQAEALLSDDPEGVVQVVGELRNEEATRFLLKVSQRTDLPMQVASRAIGAIVAEEPWEREALAKVIAESKDDKLRAAAAQAMGAFATLDEALQLLGPLSKDPSPLLRGALVWAMQIASRPAKLPKETAAKAEKELKRALSDDDVVVRRRSAYVSGNLRLTSLVPDLVELAKKEEQRADLRVAAFSGLAELASPAALDPLLGLFKREEDPAALVAASRAIIAITEQNKDVKLDLSRVQGRITHLLTGKDPALREAAVALAGLAAGVAPASALLPLAATTKHDGAPHVREAALVALGRLRAPEGEPVLLAALEDGDEAIQELAADGLLLLGGRKPLERLIDWVSGEADGDARVRVANRIELGAADKSHFVPLLNTALGRLSAGDPAYEPLIALKLKLLDDAGKGGQAISVDAAIIAVFPTYPKLAAVRGFDALNKSLRTAEQLYRTTNRMEDADHSSPIMLWLKCLEGYVHAWLAPRLSALQKSPMELCNAVDDMLGGAWPQYSRSISGNWADPVDVGGTRVEVPLRSVPNALRDFQDRRMRRLESPLSLTEWGRMMLFFAVDHPSGMKNLFKVSAKNADQVVRVAHRLLMLAQVRNIVTHRAAAGASTLEAFRRVYYSGFEEVTRLA
jgi:HEAT repeat protein